MKVIHGTVAENWDSFRKLNLSQVTDERTISKLESAFYAGAATMIGTVIKQGMEQERSEDFVKSVNSLINEVQSYAAAKVALGAIRNAAKFGGSNDGN